jgi:signal transduction histidine kinase
MFDLLDRLLDVVVRVDRDWRVTWANQQAACVLGDASGKAFWDLFPEDQVEPRAIGQKAMDDRSPTLVDANVGDLDRWFEFRFEPVGDGLWVVARDVTDRRDIGLRLREEIRELVLQLESAERRERERIAQVLHGDIQQLIVAASLTLSGLLKTAGDAARTTEYCDEVLSLLSEAQTATRSLSTELYPVMLHDEGLLAGLRWLAKRMHEKHGLAVGVNDAMGAEDGASELRNLLFDVAREALFNVVKHARVDHASLEVLQTRRATELRVIDQGAGFDPSAPPAGGGGFGLRALTIRVKAAGGDMDVQSAPGRGTTVRVILPTYSSVGPRRSQP